MAKDPERVTIVTYTNKKGDERVAVQMARATALKIAVGDPEAIERVIGGITTRIENQENAPSE